mgnify:FL=1
MNTIFSNITATVILNESGEVLNQTSNKSNKDFEKANVNLEKTAKKHKATSLNPKKDKTQLQHNLELLKDKDNFKAFYEINKEITKTQIKNAVNEDNIIVQTIACINELDKTTNLLSKRLREWTALTIPELEKRLSHHEKFAGLIKDKSRKELLKELELNENETMGAKLPEQDLRQMTLLEKQIKTLYELREEQEHYLESLMIDYCPNFLEIAGPTIGAKLFEHAKSLRKLALLPSSTIQLLGAEKALFRHLKSGTKSPKYGILFTHYLVQSAHQKDRGMVARSLASYLSRALKIDFFKGEFAGDKMREEIEKKFNYVKKEKHQTKE